MEMLQKLRQFLLRLHVKIEIIRIGLKRQVHSTFLVAALLGPLQLRTILKILMAWIFRHLKMNSTEFQTSLPQRVAFST
jgi:hypothetical protein